MYIANKVFEQSLNKNAVFWAIIILEYCTSCLLFEARELFDEMSERNDVSCSARVSGRVEEFGKCDD